MTDLHHSLTGCRPLGEPTKLRWPCRHPDDRKTMFDWTQSAIEEATVHKKIAHSSWANGGDNECSPFHLKDYAISRSVFYGELYGRTDEIRLESKRQRTELSFSIYIYRANQHLKNQRTCRLQAGDHSFLRMLRQISPVWQI